MIHALCAIYDSKIKAYMTPFAQPNTQMAIRAFINAIDDQNSFVGKNPSDYSLYKVGEYDDDAGIIYGQQLQPELLFQGK